MPIESSREIIGNIPYKEVVASELNNPAFKEIFAYDSEGDLFFRRNGIKIVDLMKNYGDRYDAAIQITDTVQVTQRAHMLKEIFRQGARLAGYPEKNIQIHYATKANFKAPIVAAALKEVDMETSSPLDLVNFAWMRKRGIVPKDKKVVCNGYKGDSRFQFDKGYGARILGLHREGVDITVVLDKNELPYYKNSVTRGVLDVGLRLKFGPVTNDGELDRLVSRFGFSWNDLQLEAKNIDQSKNLRFTMFHAMISAAHAIQPKEFVKSALFAVEKYAILRQKHPTLTHLNLGGGIPSIDSGYDYNAFLKPYLTGVIDICRKYRIPLPTIVIESGSFIATDCENLAFRVVENGVNSSDRAPWAVINGVLTNLPDIFIQEDPFTFVAANHANEPSIGIRIGDMTCDSNDVYPPKNQPEKLIHMPRKLDDLIIVAINTGAYQDVISGVGSEKEANFVLHCGNPEPIQVYIGEDRSGRPYIRSSKRPTLQEMSHLSGFSDDLAPYL